jgi:hypothetical protein
VVVVGLRAEDSEGSERKRRGECGGASGEGQREARVMAGVWGRRGG